MSSAIRTEKDPGLRADALGLVESVIMGVAGSGPAYSVAVSTATLIAAVGALAPASLLYCSLIMFGVVFAFRHLNRVAANASSALDLPLHPDLGLLAQRRRELLFQDDPAAHPPRCLPLDRRPADRHQCLSR